MYIILLEFLIICMITNIKCDFAWGFLTPKTEPIRSSFTSGLYTVVLEKSTFDNRLSASVLRLRLFIQKISKAFTSITMDPKKITPPTSEI